jgi:8-oxo-dGTP pyrophosphatase MutT (NUDIX family)
MRTSIAAFALIRRQQDGRTQYLARWNENWRRFHFVGGHKDEEESFCQCLVREVQEEMGLCPDRDFQVAAEPLAHLEYPAFSESAGVQTTYTVELFPVNLLVPDPALRDDRLRWLSEVEIRTGNCADGQPVSEAMHRVLHHVGLLGSTCN